VDVKTTALLPANISSEAATTPVVIKIHFLPVFLLTICGIFGEIFS
jgi:hypothetical protein